MEQVAALLALLQSEDGMSIHKACKKLVLSMSEMMRLLTALGPQESGGLELVERREQGGRTCLFWAERGRATLSAAKQINAETEADDETGNPFE